MAKTQYTLFHLRPDATYRLQLRAKVDGVTGKWSQAFEFATTVDETAPGPVQNLEVTYRDGSLFLSWDAPTVDENGDELTDLANYKVVVTDLDTANTGEFTTLATEEELSLQFLRWLLDPNPADNVPIELSGRFRFDVYAVDRARNESLPTAVTFEAAPPAPFNMLAFESLNQAIRITWEESVDVDLLYYDVYRNDVFIGRTISTELEYIDGNPGSDAHAYHVVAVDAFGLTTRSTNTLTGARAFGYWQGDLTVPDPPSNLTFAGDISNPDGSNTDVLVSFDAPTTNEDASPYEDNGEFLLEWSKSLSGPWQSTRIADTRVDGTVSQTFSTGLNDLASSTVYFFRVSAIDRYTNQSAYFNGTYTTPTDELAPSQPVAPTAAANLLRIQVTHSGNRLAGGKLEDDVRELEVHVGTSSSFTPGPSTLVGTLSTLAPSSGFSATGSFPIESVLLRWVKVIAVDGAGNKSEPSLATDATQIQLVTDAFIENASITNASIANLSAAKLLADTAFVNDLGVQSKLTVGTGGTIESANFSPSSGYRLSESGLEIYNGFVAASALAINNSPNLVPWAFSSFEVTGLYLFGGTDAGGNTVAPQTSVTANANTSAIAVDAWEGERSLRFRSAVGTSGGSPAEILFAPTGTAYNIPTTAGEKYVYSVYVKSASSYAATLFVKWQGGATPESAEAVTIPATAGKWVRVSKVFTAPASSTRAIVGIRTASPNVDFNVDAMQLELVTSSAADNLLTPSAWKAPSMTSINGGQITTGELVSTNFTASTGWRVGLEGNATFYNVFARGTIQAETGYLKTMDVTGTLTVGAGSSGLIRHSSGSWSLSANGSFTANNANITGFVTATGGNFSNVNAFSINVGSSGQSGYIQSQNWTGWPGLGWRINSDGSAFFNSASIRGSLNANDITAGTLSADRINGGTITGVTIQTPLNSTWGRVQINGATTGDAGIVLQNGSGSTIGRLYASGSTAYFGSTGFIDMDTTVRIREVQGTNVGGLNVGSDLIMLSSNAIKTSSGFLEIGSSLDMNGNAINNTATIESDQINIQSTPTSSTTIGQIRPTGSDLLISDQGSGKSGIRFVAAAVRATSNAGSGFRVMEASAFTVNSVRSAKRDIRPAGPMLDRVNAMKVRSYELKEAGSKEHGLVIDELREVAPEVISEAGDTVSLYPLIAMALRSIQELSEKVELLEANVKIKPLG